MNIEHLAETRLAGNARVVFLRDSNAEPGSKALAGSDLDVVALIASIFEEPDDPGLSGEIRILVDVDADGASSLRIEAGCVIAGTCTFSGSSIVETGARVENSVVRDSWVAGQVRNSEIEGRLVVADERIEGQSLAAYRAGLCDLVAHPEDWVPGAFRHSELDAENRQGILGYYLDHPIGLKAILAPIADSELREEAFERCRRLCAHPIFESLSPESFYRYPFALVRRLATDEDGADPYALDKARFRDDVAEIAAGLCRSVLDAGRESLSGQDAVASDLDDDAGKPAHRIHSLQQLLIQLLETSAAANLFDGQSREASVLLAKDEFMADIEAGLAAAVEPQQEALELSKKVLLHCLDRPGPVVYLTDNYEEAYFDAALWACLIALGKEVVVAGKAKPARGDATLEDLIQIRADLESRVPGLAEHWDASLKLTHNGADTYGILLDRVPPALRAQMRRASFVYAKGQANLYTSFARNMLKTPIWWLMALLVKGQTARMMQAAWAESPAGRTALAGLGAKAEASGDRESRIPALVIALSSMQRPLGHGRGKRKGRDEQSKPLFEPSPETWLAGQTLRAEGPRDPLLDMHGDAYGAPSRLWSYVLALQEIGSAEVGGGSDSTLLSNEYSTPPFGAFLPAAGQGSRFSRLIPKPIATVDGVNTVLQHVLNSCRMAQLRPLVVALGDEILERMILGPMPEVGVKIDLAELDAQVLADLLGPADDLLLLRSPADGNGAAFMRAWSVLCQEYQSGGSIKPFLVALNSDFPSIILRRYLNLPLALRYGSVGSRDAETGVDAGRSPEVVLAVKSPMTPDAVVSKGNVQIERSRLQPEIAVPSRLREWREMSDAEREGARKNNRLSLESSRPEHFLNTTALAFSGTELAWYMQAIIKPHFKVIEKGKDEYYFVQAIELAHRTSQLEGMLLSQLEGLATHRDEHGDRIQTQAVAHDIRLEWSREDLLDWLANTVWSEVEGRHAFARMPLDELGQRHAAQRNAFFADALDAAGQAGLQDLSQALVDRILLFDRVLPGMLNTGLLEIADHAGSIIWISQAARDDRLLGIGAPRTRLIQAGEDAPYGIKDAGRLLRFENDLLAQTRQVLAECGVDVDETTRLRVRLNSISRSSYPAGFDFDSDLKTMICAEDPSSIRLRGDLIVDSQTRLGDRLVLDGRHRPVQVGAGFVSDMRSKPEYTGSGIGDRGAKLELQERFDLQDRQQLYEIDAELMSKALDGLKTRRVILHAGGRLRLLMTQELDVRECLEAIFSVDAQGIADQIHLYGDVIIDARTQIGAKSVVIKDSCLLGANRIGSGTGLDGALLVDTEIEDAASSTTSDPKRVSAFLKPHFAMPNLADATNPDSNWMHTPTAIIDSRLEVQDLPAGIVIYDESRLGEAPS